MKTWTTAIGVCIVMLVAITAPYLQHKPITESTMMGAGEPRSLKWPRVRATYLKSHPECIACGGKNSLNVHHIVSFSVDPTLELTPSNFCTLCTESHFGGINCHHVFGHNFLWTCRNPNVVRDAQRFREMVDSRLCNQGVK